MTERVILVPYNPDWPRRFEEERHILAAVFAGTEVVIEHIGSTAVPGLGAKPVIDVMIGVGALADVEARIPALQAMGYEYVQRHEQVLPERRYFGKPRQKPREFHLHCVVKGSDFWVRHLAFRDYLRAHPEVAAAYYELKQDLAARLTKEAYTEAKTPFIQSVLRKTEPRISQMNTDQDSLWQRGEYSISTNRSRLDINLIHDYISNHSYWGKGRPREVVERSIENSMAFGVYVGDQQVAFARIVTDYATFAWLADVFVVPEHRGRGLSKWLMEMIIAHPRLQGFRRWVLATKDAQGLYEQFGFIKLHRPERWMERFDPNMKEAPDYWQP